MKYNHNNIEQFLKKMDEILDAAFDNACEGIEDDTHFVVKFGDAEISFALDPVNFEETVRFVKERAEYENNDYEPLDGNDLLCKYIDHMPGGLKDENLAWVLNRGNLPFHEDLIADIRKVLDLRPSYSVNLPSEKVIESIIRSKLITMYKCSYDKENNITTLVFDGGDELRPVASVRGDSNNNTTANAKLTSAWVKDLDRTIESFKNM